MEPAAVQATVADVRREPDHSSERVNQALFGEMVRIGERRKGFARTTQYDGYEGWIDERLLRAVPDADADKMAESNVIVSVPWTRPRRGGEHHPDMPWILYFGTRLRTEFESDDGYHLVAWPGDEELWVRGEHLRPLPPLGGPPAGRHLVMQARRFLGVPYLWGGITTTGFDCSGLVRTVALSFGVQLPRDTKDQISEGVAVGRRGIKSGDLLFFERHVAIAMSDGRFIHASRAAAGVTINSLRPDSSEYRSDLADTFAQARRIV
jgi:hypothetical protein